MSTGAILWASDMARIFGVSEDRLYDLARRRHLPCAVSTKSPRRLFIRQGEMDLWANAIRDEDAA